ncbi:MAG: hypothetical protein HY789_10520 [Deltaproteobacteria bacterium]|nr:hypothetical protein [Deltaproteobacteria bacterium]
MQWTLVPMFFLLALTVHPAVTQARWKFPPLPPPHQYGNIMINRTSEASQVKPVFFPHWSHRIKYACRVCHLELEFEFAVNTTPITEEDNINGYYCGACHNGTDAFAHTKENCDKCHSGNIDAGREKFAEATKNLPRTPFGNQVDWVLAASLGQIKPRYVFRKESEKTDMNFRNRLELQAEWNFVPPAYFPHDVHIELLDCGNCHPDIFNLKKKTTPHFAMDFILEKKFCGVCHLKIAFPLNDCQRCHPGMENNPRF